MSLRRASARDRVQPQRARTFAICWASGEAADILRCSETLKKKLAVRQRSPDGKVPPGCFTGAVLELPSGADGQDATHGAGTQAAAAAQQCEEATDFVAVLTDELALRNRDARKVPPEDPSAAQVYRGAELARAVRLAAKAQDQQALTVWLAIVRSIDRETLMLGGIEAADMRRVLALRNDGRAPAADEKREDRRKAERIHTTPASKLDEHAGRAVEQMLPAA